MSTTLLLTSRLGRPAERQNLITRELREQIVEGVFAPGSRLPTRDEIGQKYGAGPHTVQRALDTLKQDGFTQPSGRNGTYVSKEPPHLTRYAIVFPGVPSETENWVNFWTALSNEAMNVQRSQGRKLPLYHGVSHDPAVKDYQTLLQDVLAHRVAGIIFAGPTYSLEGTPILNEPGLPRVCIMSSAGSAIFPAIHHDVDSFFDKAMGYLQQQGCRKIAVLNPPGLEWTDEALQKKIAAYGMETRPYWNQTTSLTCAHTARNVTHLLMNAGQSDRPDGLIISDDNLVKYSAAGLLDAGVRVPEEIKVVAHCNFPWPTSRGVQVQRLGFDASEVLRSALAYIDAMRRGEPVTPDTDIPARFEDELLEAA